MNYDSFKFLAETTPGVLPTIITKSAFDKNINILDFFTRYLEELEIESKTNKEVVSNIWSNLFENDHLISSLSLNKKDTVSFEEITLIDATLSNLDIFSALSFYFGDKTTRTFDFAIHKYQNSEKEIECLRRISNSMKSIDQDLYKNERHSTKLSLAILSNCGCEKTIKTIDINWSEISKDAYIETRTKKSSNLKPFDFAILNLNPVYFDHLLNVKKIEFNISQNLNLDKEKIGHKTIISQMFKSANLEDCNVELGLAGKMFCEYINRSINTNTTTKADLNKFSILDSNEKNLNPRFDELFSKSIDIEIINSFVNDEFLYKIISQGAYNTGSVFFSKLIFDERLKNGKIIDTGDFNYSPVSQILRLIERKESDNEKYFSSLKNAIDVGFKISRDSNEKLFDFAKSNRLDDIVRLADLGFDVEIKDQRGWGIKSHLDKDHKDQWDSIVRSRKAKVAANLAVDDVMKELGFKP